MRTGGCTSLGAADLISRTPDRAPIEPHRAALRRRCSELGGELCHWQSVSSSSPRAGLSSRDWNQHSWAPPGPQRGLGRPAIAASRRADPRRVLQASRPRSYSSSSRCRQQTHLDTHELPTCPLFDLAGTCLLLALLSLLCSETLESLLYPSTVDNILSANLSPASPGLLPISPLSARPPTEPLVVMATSLDRAANSSLTREGLQLRNLSTTRAWGRLHCACLASQDPKLVGRLLASRQIASPTQVELRGRPS